MGKKLEELNLIDNFLFEAAAGYGEKGRKLCQIMLEIILERDLPHLTVEIQKVITAVDTDKHGIRMDVLIKETAVEEGEKETLYDIEMEKTDFVPQRARYYHALEDRKLLDSGDDYRNLGTVFVIIIMPKDPFGKDRMVYTIKRRVLEDTTIEYEDGDITMYLYTKGTVTDGRTDLQELLNYIEHSEKNNAKVQRSKRFMISFKV